MSSILARDPYPGYDVYAASKVALEGLTRQWAVTLAKPFGITANAIICGSVETEMIQGAAEDVKEGLRAKASVEHRLGTTDDIAQVVAFLAGEGSRWVNGQCIGVHGGMLFT